MKENKTIALHKAEIRFDLQTLQKEALCIVTEENLPYGVYLYLS